MWTAVSADNRHFLYSELQPPINPALQTLFI